MRKIQFSTARVIANTAQHTNANESTSSTTHAPHPSTPPPDFPLPYLNPLQETYFSPQTLQKDEVKNLIDQAPHRKAFGEDGVAYEAMKMCSTVIEPYLSWIFQACLDRCIHPDRFKNCITIVIRKPGKQS